MKVFFVVVVGGGAGGSGGLFVFWIRLTFKSVDYE